MKDEVYAKDFSTWMAKTGGYAKDKTLRDEFAMRAMQGQLSMPELCAAIGSGHTTVDSFCRSCFEWADAMLAARGGK